ncbi:hypothetical protein IQ60_31475 [Streptomyces europaeiscabiei]|nr:hypothetical protein IQ60_31475 [Streptomyces europaeiscabiei]
MRASCRPVARSGLLAAHGLGDLLDDRVEVQRVRRLRSVRLIPTVRTASAVSTVAQRVQRRREGRWRSLSAASLLPPPESRRPAAVSVMAIPSP